MKSRTELLLKRLVACILAAGSAATLVAGPPDKNPPAPTVVESAWTLPLFGAGVKTNDAYTDGNVFLTLPVWSTIGTGGTLGGNYLFIEPYSSLGEGGEVATSLGLAYRHLFSHESVAALQKKGVAGFMEEGWFLGANVFVDMLDTQHHNSFWQLGVGAEVGNRYLEVRGNYYIPLTGEQLAQRNVSERSFTSSSTRYQQSGSGYGDPYATGNQVAQDVNLTTSATTTYRTTTIRTITEIYEKGMEGWDAELSLLVPRLDQWVDLRVIGGYFSFDNQPFGPQSFGTGNVHGWKVGVELRPVPAVVLSGMWYEDKRLTGGNWTVGLQLQVPLDRTWREAFTPRHRHLVEHLAEPVHRQNDAIKIGNEKKEHSTSTVSTRRVTRVVRQEQGHLVLADDVIFVNNGPAVGNGIQAGNDLTGDGTAEKPVATIQNGANIAGGNSNTTGRTWNVYTQGGGATTTYAESVMVKGSTNFVSSFSALAGQGGKVFGGNTPRPVVNGGFLSKSSPDAEVGFVGITGYEITGGLVTSVLSDKGGIAAGQGIFFENVFDGVIRDNFIHATARNGIYAENNGITSSRTNGLEVSSNIISGNGDHGMVASSFDTVTSTFNVNGNTFSGNGLYGFAGSTDQSATGNFTLYWNTITANSGGGVLNTASSSSVSSFSMFENTVHDQPGQGVYLKALGTASYPIADISDNTFARTGSNGIRVEIGDPVTNGASATLSLVGNTITDSGSDAIYVKAQKNGVGFLKSVQILALSNNTIADSSGNGITLRAESGGLLSAPNISGNTITNSSSNGIMLYADGPASATFPTILTATVTGNDFNGAGGDYINSVSNTSSTLNLTANNNTLHSAIGVGIRSTSAGTSTTTLVASKNTISDQDAQAILASAFGGSTFNATITGNTIVDPGLDGIYFTASDAGTKMHIIALDDNTITRPGAASDGIFMASGSGATFTADSISGNAITGVTGAGASRNGMTFAVNAGGTLTATLVSGNTITTPGNQAMSLTSTGSGALTAAITGNTLVSPGGGIWMGSTGSSNLSTTVSSNTITSASAIQGVTVQSNDSSIFKSDINDNTITTGSNGQGILVSTNTTGSTTLTVGGNTITVGGGASNGVHFNPNDIQKLKVNVGITPVDNTVILGAGFFLKSDGTTSFFPGSQIRINGTTHTLPASF